MTTGGVFYVELDCDVIISKETVVGFFYILRFLRNFNFDFISGSQLFFFSPPWCTVKKLLSLNSRPYFLQFNNKNVFKF